MISKKVIITGAFGVGKTSLFNRFISNTFGEKYLTTIGVKVEKKMVEVNGQQLSMIIWDIAGEVTQDKVPRSYFLGSSALIYVFDILRPLTYENLDTDLEYLESILPGCVRRVVGNKIDLVSEEDLESFKQKIDADLFTSAKTGDNVEDLFMGIAKELLDRIVEF